MKYITLDTETTGFSPKNGDRLVEIAAILNEDGVEIDRFQSLINPQRSVPSQAVAVHGLSEYKLKDAPLFSKVARDFADFLSQADRWAHNAAFDKRFLAYEFDRCGVTWPGTIQCSLKLAKDRVEGPHKLENLAARAGWKWEGRGAHSAIEDSRALSKVLMMLWDIKKEPTQTSIQTHTSFQPVFTDGMDSRLMEDVGNFTAHKRGKPWTKPQDEQLKTAWMAGQGLASLCPLMGRSPAAVALRLEAMGLIKDHPYSGYRRK